MVAAAQPTNRRMDIGKRISRKIGGFCRGQCAAAMLADLPGRDGCGSGVAAHDDRGGYLHRSRPISASARLMQHLLAHSHGENALCADQ
jgi:hypothetical protein